MSNLVTNYYHVGMSELKPVMVRLPPEVYEKLRASAFDLAMPPAVLARVLIKQQLDIQGESQEFKERPLPTEGRRNQGRRRGAR